MAGLREDSLEAAAFDDIAGRSAGVLDFVA
jgi:hypothetical protein